MEALLTMFAAECCLGRELTRTELIDGSLSTLLEPEDFDEAFNVSFTYLTVTILASEATLVLFPLIFGEKF